MTSKNKNDWIQQANCKGLDTNMFFPEKKKEHQTEYTRKEVIENIHQICNTCTVKMECYQYALETEKDYKGHINGYYAGLSPRQRYMKKNLAILKKWQNKQAKNSQ